MDGLLLLPPHSRKQAIGGDGGARRGSNCCRGLVRQQRLGVDRLLLLPPHSREEAIGGDTKARRIMLLHRWLHMDPREGWGRGSRAAALGWEVTQGMVALTRRSSRGR